MGEAERQLIDEKNGGICHDAACNRQHLLLTATQRACFLGTAFLQAREHIVM